MIDEKAPMVQPSEWDHIFPENFFTLIYKYADEGHEWVTTYHRKSAKQNQINMKDRQQLVNDLGGKIIYAGHTVDLPYQILNSLAWAHTTIEQSVMFICRVKNIQRFKIKPAQKKAHTWQSI